MRSRALMTVIFSVWYRELAHFDRLSWLGFIAISNYLSRKEKIFVREKQLNLRLRKPLQRN